MQKSDKEKLSRQLQSVSENIETLEGFELLDTMLSTCNALLKVSGNIIADKTNENVSDDIYANYLKFASNIKWFFENNSTQNCEDNKKKNKDLKKILDDIEFQTEDTAKKNESLQAQIKELKEKLEKQNQQNENEKQELSTLQNQKKKLDEENKSINESVANIKDDIEKIPDENKRLNEEFKKLKTQFSELQNAKTEYTPEKRKEFEDSIAKLEKDIADVKPIIDELSKTKTNYDKECQTLTTNLIDVIESRMSELNVLLTEHSNTLDKMEEIKNTNAELKEKLKVCEDHREEFFARCNADKDFFNKLIDAAQKTENSNTRNLLNVEIPKANTLLNEIEDKLKEIEEILEKGQNSMDEDFDITKQRRENA